MIWLEYYARVSIISHLWIISPDLNGDSLAKFLIGPYLRDDGFRDVAKFLSVPDSTVEWGIIILEKPIPGKRYGHEHPLLSIELDFRTAPWTPGANYDNEVWDRCGLRAIHYPTGSFCWGLPFILQQGFNLVVWFSQFFAELTHYIECKIWIFSE